MANISNTITRISRSLGNKVQNLAFVMFLKGRQGSSRSLLSTTHLLSISLVYAKSLTIYRSNLGGLLTEAIPFVFILCKELIFLSIRCSLELSYSRDQLLQQRGLHLSFLAFATSRHGALRFVGPEPISTSLSHRWRVLCDLSQSGICNCSPPSPCPSEEIKVASCVA